MLPKAERMRREARFARNRVLVDKESETLGLNFEYGSLLSVVLKEALEKIVGRTNLSFDFIDLLRKLRTTFEASIGDIGIWDGAENASYPPILSIRKSWRTTVQTACRGTMLEPLAVSNAAWNDALFLSPTTDPKEADAFIDKLQDRMWETASGRVLAHVSEKNRKKERPYFLLGPAASSEICDEREPWVSGLGEELGYSREVVTELRTTLAHDDFRLNQTSRELLALLLPAPPHYT